MSPISIRAVAFDLGGTIEEIIFDDATWQEATRGLQGMLRALNLDPGLPLSELQNAVMAGMIAYRRWREQTLVELPPEQVWTEYVFPDHGVPRDRLAAAAEELMLYFENHYMTRSLRPEVPGVLETLHGRGFRLAVISNVMSRRQVRHNLAVYGVEHYFNPIVTSVEMGIRKPHPQIFLEAARLMDLPPAACAFVGDTVSRDIAGARRAGYGLAIQIKSFLTGIADRETATERPDAIVRDLREIIPLVTGR